MKTNDQMEAVIANAMDPDRQKYAGMTYEDGIRDVLEWVLGNTTDEEFQEYLED